MIRPYLSVIINDYKTQREWKIHLKMAMNFLPSKDSEETRTIYSKSDNIEVAIGSETEEIIEGLFDSFLKDTKKN